MADEATCPLCDQRTLRQTVAHAHLASIYTNCEGYCPSFAAWRTDEEVWLRNPANAGAIPKDRLRIMLIERELQGLPRAALQFSKETHADIPNSIPVYVPDLLEEFPASVPEILDRSLLNVGRKSKGQCGGTIRFRPFFEDRGLFFDRGPDQAVYVLRALRDAGFVTQERGSDQEYEISVTPRGWARVNELMATEADTHHPAFVAMWFGGETARLEMRTLYHDAFKPAIKSAGWRVKRADSDEHNNYIMDQIRADIRKAPFLVADLTSQNNGVYYEAGFAAGLGRPVIVCCPEHDTGDRKVHFDIAQINRIIYKDVEDLCNKLHARIVGTIGEGPFLKSRSAEQL